MIQKIQIKYSSVSKKLIFLYQKFLKSLFLKFNLKYTIINLPKKYKLKTFLKSPHVNKKAKENFKYTLYSFKLNTSFNFNYLKILKYNVPKNINLTSSCEIKLKKNQ